jgi:putative transposase
LLPKLTRRNKKTTTKKKPTEKQKQDEAEAKKLYQHWQENHPEVVTVSEKFILANCYNPYHVKEFLSNYY